MRERLLTFSLGLLDSLRLALEIAAGVCFAIWLLYLLSSGFKVKPDPKLDALHEKLCVMVWRQARTTSDTLKILTSIKDCGPAGMAGREVGK